MKVTLTSSSLSRLLVAGFHRFLQFCYRPIAADREPIIGPLAPNIFVSTAMGPWGITLAPGAGKVVAEMMLGRKQSADVRLLAPGRFTQAKL